MDTLILVVAYILCILGGGAIMFAIFGHEYNKENNPCYDGPVSMFFVKAGLIGVVLFIAGLLVNTLRS